MATLHGLPASGTVMMVSVKPSFDPQAGSVYEVEFVGGRNEIRLATVGWGQSGARVRVDESGPLSRALVVWSGTNRNPSDPSGTIGSETPVDRYETRTDLLEVSLFSLPLVAAEAARFAATFPERGSMALYRSEIETAARNGDPLPISGTLFPIAAKLYLKIARGEESFTNTRVSLMRVRSYSAIYTGQRRLVAIPPIYRTSTLVQYETIPQAVVGKLPADPLPQETPAGGVWGWKVMDESSSYSPRENKFEERTTWTFAAWDSDIYPVL